MGQAAARRLVGTATPVASKGPRRSRAGKRSKSVACIAPALYGRYRSNRMGAIVSSLPVALERAPGLPPVGLVVLSLREFVTSVV
jgi:hypothetical protein